MAPDADADQLAAAIEHALESDAAARRRAVAREHEWSRILADRVVPLVLGERSGTRSA